MLARRRQHKENIEQAWVWVDGWDIGWCGDPADSWGWPTLRPTRLLSVCQWRMQHFHILYSTWWKTSIFYILPDRKSTQGSGHAKASQIGLPFVFPIQRTTIHGIALPFTALQHCSALKCKGLDTKSWNQWKGWISRGASLDHSIEAGTNSSSAHFQLQLLNAQTTFEFQVKSSNIQYTRTTHLKPHYVHWVDGEPPVLCVSSWNSTKCNWVARQQLPRKVLHRSCTDPTAYNRKTRFTWHSPKVASSFNPGVFVGRRGVGDNLTNEEQLVVFTLCNKKADIFS